MKIKVILPLVVVVILSVLSSCHMARTKTANLAPGVHEITAAEVLQTSSYTYIRATEDGNEYWLAINREDVKTGGTYFWAKGGEMKNFFSKELKRSFPSIFFVEVFSDKPITNAAQPQLPGSMAGKPQAPQKTGISIQPVAGGISIATLYAKRDSFKGKQVKIRGEVVKFSPDIMKKNWVHLQDGTRDGDHYDLTFTTLDVVKPGDVVTFSGTVTLNKDFGAGYVYGVVIEDAKLEK